jgi:hypothetical protein
VDAGQLSRRDRLVSGRALDAVKEFYSPLDAVAIEYREARKLLNGASLLDCRALLFPASWQRSKVQIRRRN